MDADSPYDHLMWRRGEARIGATLHKRIGLRQWQAFLRNAKRVREGDRIEIDIPNRSIHLAVDDAETFGSIFTSIFLVMGLFSIGAGVLHAVDHRLHGGRDRRLGQVQGLRRAGHVPALGHGEEDAELLERHR